QVRVNEKRGFGTTFPLQLRLHSLQLLARFLNRAPESLNLLSYLFRPQLEIERYEQRIEGSNGFSDRDAYGCHYAVYDALVTHVSSGQILTNAVHCFVLIGSVCSHTQSGAEAGRKQKDAQDAARVRFDGLRGIRAEQNDRGLILR